MEFHYKIEQKEHYALVSLNGNLLKRDDAFELIEAIEQLVFTNNTYFALNLEQMDYINSSGLNVLINLLTKIRNSGGEMAVYNVPKKIQQLLLITKLNSIFNVSQTLGEAERTLANAMKITNKHTKEV